MLSKIFLEMMTRTIATIKNVDSKDGGYKFCDDIDDDDSGSNSPSAEAV
jgi:hypothetical protein